MNSNWIPVSEKLPEPKVDVLFVFRCGQNLANREIGFGRLSDRTNHETSRSAEIWENDLNLGYDGSPELTFNVTHWMSLPDLPSDADR